MSLIILKYLHSKSLIYDALVHDDRKAKKKMEQRGSHYEVVATLVFKTF